MNEPIVLGRIDESFHQVAAAVVEEVLLRLGHGVEVREGPHPQMYPLLAAGRAAPVRRQLAARAATASTGSRSATRSWRSPRSSTVHAFFWAVPGYVPAELVSALPDLARPEVTRADGDARRAGHDPRRGADDAIAAARARLRAGRGGLEPRIGDLQAIIRTVDERIAAGDWFVTPLWQPQYLNDVHDLRPLDDPRGVFPPPDRASLIAHRDAFDRLPERTRDVLGRIRFTVADVNAMDRAVNLGGLDPLAAARAWMTTTADAVRTWLD